MTHTRRASRSSGSTTYLLLVAAFLRTACLHAQTHSAAAADAVSPLAVRVKPAPGWTSRFEELAYVRTCPPQPGDAARHKRGATTAGGTLSCAVTAVAAVAPEARTAVPRLLAVGDAAGRLFILSAYGDILFQAGPAGSSVTAVSSWLVQRQRSALATGHADGRVLIRSLVESSTTASVDGTNPDVTLLPPGEPPVPASDSAECLAAVETLHIVPLTGGGPAGRVLVATRAGGVVTVHDAATGTPLACGSIPGHQQTILAIRPAAGNAAQSAAAGLMLHFVHPRGLGALFVRPLSRNATPVPLPRIATVAESPPCSGLAADEHLVAVAFDAAAGVTTRAWGVTNTSHLLRLSHYFTHHATRPGAPVGPQPRCAVLSRRTLHRQGDTSSPGLAGAHAAMAALQPHSLVVATQAGAWLYDTQAPSRNASMQPALVTWTRREAVSVGFTAAGGAHPTTAPVLMASRFGMALALSLDGTTLAVFQHLPALRAVEAAAAAGAASGNGGSSSNTLLGRPWVALLGGIVAYQVYQGTFGGGGLSSGSGRRQPGGSRAVYGHAPASPMHGQQARADAAMMAALRKRGSGGRDSPGGSSGGGLRLDGSRLDPQLLAALTRRMHSIDADALDE
jgi:hypothetical protein